MHAYSLGDIGLELKANLKSGRPTKTKRYRDYTGLVIEPCGSYAGNPNATPPWLLRREGHQVTTIIPSRYDVAATERFITF